MPVSFEHKKYSLSSQPAANPVGRAEAKFAPPKLLGVASEMMGVTNVAIDDFPTPCENLNTVTIMFKHTAYKE